MTRIPDVARSARSSRNASLVALLVVAQGFDLVTYLQAPHLEANPAMAAAGTGLVVLAKPVAVWAMVAIASRIPTPWLSELALGIGIAVGAFAAGTNLASISWASG